MCNTDKSKDHRHNCWNCGRIQNINGNLVCDKFMECLHFDYWEPIRHKEIPIDKLNINNIKCEDYVVDENGQKWTVVKINKPELEPKEPEHLIIKPSDFWFPMEEEEERKNE